MVWEEERQERKAVCEEVTALVAEEEEAEEAWWTVLEVEACVMGMVVDVVIGLLLIQSCTGSGCLVDMFGCEVYVDVLFEKCVLLIWLLVVKFIVTSRYLRCASTLRLQRNVSAVQLS